MQPNEFKAIREKLQMTRSEFAGFLGYTGSDATKKRRIRAFESGEEIPLYIARLAWLIRRFTFDEIVMFDDANRIEWPDWPGYPKGENDVHED